MKEANVNEAFIDYIMNVNKTKINQAVRKCINSTGFEEMCVKKVTDEISNELNRDVVDVDHIDRIVEQTLRNVARILVFNEEVPKNGKNEDTYQTAKEAVLKYLKYNNNFVDKNTLVSICGDSVKDLENAGVIVANPEKGGYIAGEGYNE